VTVVGNHSLRSDLATLRTAVEDWLPSVLSGARRIAR
jgi:hypothetical protein